MLSNRSMPRCTVIPELGYPDVLAASDWLRDAFGFTVRLRIADHRVQMNVGDGAVVLTTLAATEEPIDRAHAVMVRVDDIDRHYERAKTLGARIIRPPTNYPYGERQCTVVDPGGHVWTFSQSVADVDPEDWGGTTGEI